jgi:hypothetical protein
MTRLAVFAAALAVPALTIAGGTAIAATAAKRTPFQTKLAGSVRAVPRQRAARPDAGMNNSHQDRCGDLCQGGGGIPDRHGRLADGGSVSRATRRSAAKDQNDLFCTP